MRNGVDTMMKLWVDPVKEAPNNSYTHLYSVDEMKNFVLRCEKNLKRFKELPKAMSLWEIQCIVFPEKNEDFCAAVKWLTQTDRSYTIFWALEKET